CTQTLMAMVDRTQEQLSICVRTTCPKSKQRRASCKRRQRPSPFRMVPEKRKTALLALRGLQRERRFPLPRLVIPPRLQPPAPNLVPMERNRHEIGVIALPGLSRAAAPRVLALE